LCPGEGAWILQEESLKNTDAKDSSNKNVTRTQALSEDKGKERGFWFEKKIGEGEKRIKVFHQRLPIKNKEKSQLKEAA